MGNTGKATSFFDAEGDGDVAGKLVEMLTKTGVEVPDWLGEAGAGGCGGGRIGVFLRYCCGCYSLTGTAMDPVSFIVV